ncbi:MAG: SusC/RagA family TonB-linked outer membrane protein [Ginsengibacter sp.]
MKRSSAIFTLFTVLMFFGMSAYAQNHEISGTVKDDSGTPVSGASVIIKGTPLGVAANARGEFTIMAKMGQILEISATNFTTMDVKLDALTNLNIVLKAGTNVMETVVVTALGIKREVRSLSSASQSISSDELNKSGTGNPLSELSGKASGLTVINSTGDPGGGTYIRLRGVTSITGNNQPLMVVDGVPIDNSINNFDPTNAGAQASGAGGQLTGGAQPTNRGVDINPDDIQSINVLKGPAATALYGIQAASGAIIITTKNGTGRKGTRIQLNSSFTLDKVSNLPPLQNMYSQGSNGSYSPPEDGSSTSWGARIDTLSWDGTSDYLFDKHGNIVGKSDPSAKIPVTPYDRYSFFQNGYTYDNSIALSGASAADKSSYRLSLGNLNQTGIIPLSKYNKTNLGLNGQSKITDKLTASAGFFYTHSDNSKIQQGSQLSGAMLGLFRTPPTFDNSNGFSDAANHPDAYTLPDGTQRNYRGGGGYDNPYWSVNNNPFLSNLDRVFGYAQATYKVLDWISLNYRVGGDVYSQNDKQVVDIGSNQAPAGAVYLIDYTNRQYNSDFTINMHKSLSDNWEGSLILGHNYFVLNQFNRFSQGTSLVVPGFFDLSNATSFLANETEVRKRSMAFYGQAELNYKKELYLTLTGRRETSSTLPAANNTFFYPSVGLGWVFTELKSLKNSNWLSFGKLRASFAQVGKDAPAYSLTTPYTSASFKDGFTNGITFPVNGIGGYQISSAIVTIGNLDLKPENTYSYELGTDLQFLHNRIGLNATAYYSRSSDVIFPISVPYSSGFAGKLLNAATIDNKGLELTLTTTPVKLDNGLRWDVNFNWSRNINKVISLAPGFDRFFIGGFGGGEAEIDAVAGQPYGMIYGSTTPHAVTGDLKSPLLISDIKDDPGYAMPLAGGAGPLEVIGNPNPNWFGSVISNLSYKGITFGFQIDVKDGGDLWNGTRGALANKGTAGETSNRGNPVTFNGLLGHLNDNGDVVHYDKDGVTELPGPGAPNTTAATYSQYYWQQIGNSFGAGQETDVENGGYTRIRQVSFSYKFNNNVFGKNHFTNLSITIFANNLKIWTKYDGVDPETSLGGPSNLQGLDYFNNPGTKSYGVRLSLGL